MGNSRIGFTLIEMSVVVAIIGVLYMTVVPIYSSTIQRAKEAALKENLQVLRKTFDVYYKDRQVWPSNLKSLVGEGYVRAIPVDPLTNKVDSWVTVPSESGKDDIFDIRSGAIGKSLDGTPYSSW